MTEINEKFVVELLKKKGIRLYEEEITYVDPFEGEIEVGIDGAIFIKEEKVNI
jgi:hypothetical protein